MTESFPTRVSVTTFNVWGSTHWPRRAESLFQTFQSLRSDIYLLQEVNREIIGYLDNSFNGQYTRVQGKGGWLTESNIYWNSALFELVDHGKSDLAIEDYPDRGLFWIRLSLKSKPEITIFLSTAHFPWVGCNTEIATGMNQR